MRIYNQLRQAYPGKRIVIAEFGWPSAGYNRHEAVPDPLIQAAVLRAFVSRAEAMGIDYNIIEAYDQPWKTVPKAASVPIGASSTRRAQPKFSWTGPIANPDHWKLTAIAVADGRAAVAADPGADRRDLRPGGAARQPPPTPPARGLRSCSPSGTATTSCRARRSRSGSRWCC